MRARLFLLPALALFVNSPAAAASDTAEKTVVVRLGRPVAVTAVNQSNAGDSTSTTWLIVRDNNRLFAVDVQPALRAQTSDVLRTPGIHHLVAKCGNHIASVESCTITATPMR
jgi:hypothetical protein